MNDTDSNALADLKKQVADLSRAMKIGFFALLLVASYFNIRVAFYIPEFGRIFNDMTGDPSALPADTSLVIAARQELVALACALPAVGITALFAKTTNRSIIVLGICLVVAVTQYVFVWWALAAPFVRVIKAMASPNNAP